MAEVGLTDGVSYSDYFQLMLMAGVGLDGNYKKIISFIYVGLY